MQKDASFLRSFLTNCLLFITILALNVHAGEGEKVKLSLISESTAVGSDATLLLGLRAQITPGWKTYWRSPGVAGYGLNLTWEGSKNIKSITILWPLPHRAQTQLGSVNVYEGDIVFPLLVELKDASKPMHASLQVDMLACDESNCLPVMEGVTLDLPAGPKDLSPEEPLLHKAMNTVPKHELLQNQFQIQNVEVVGAEDVPPLLHVTLSKTMGTFSKNNLPELFLEIQGLVVDAPRISISKNQKSICYVAAVFPDDQRKPTLLPDLVGKPITLTVGYQDEGFELHKILKVETYSFGFWAGMFLIAFIGGLILNFMPCVLPVLSLKVLSVIRHGGGHKRAVRQEFVSTAAGIIFSFLLLAGGAIFLKVSGHAVGWGIQFQEPYFIIALIGILTLFACNLFGFFEFRLPTFLSSLGGISPHRESLAGSFLEGSLVTALATPCTAPFLGTALAFALSRGSLEIMSIFFAMGLGLAFPFLIIALFPKFATKLPKPGAWMVTVKYGLGFLIVLTAIWLLYVLIAEIGQAGASLVAMMMLFISLVLKKTRNGSEAKKKIAWLGAGLLITGSFALPALMTHSLTTVSSHKKDMWHPFEPNRIADYVKMGKIVFVSVTADWCLTCQANKYFALKNREVLEALHGPNVVAMEADWTNHDPKITAYLKSFNQYGIPFYAVYGCKTPGGAFLGQLLTPHKVLNALNRETCAKP